MALIKPIKNKSERVLSLFPLLSHFNVPCLPYVREKEKELNKLLDTKGLQWGVGAALCKRTTSMSHLFELILQVVESLPGHDAVDKTLANESIHVGGVVLF